MEGPGKTCDRNDVLHRLSDHLDTLAADIHAIEQVIGEELKHRDPNAPGRLLRLQRLDFIRQSLEDTAMLTHLMSRQDGDRLPRDISSKLKLDATRQMLDGQRGPAPSLPAGTSSGEVDLF